MTSDACRSCRFWERDAAAPGAQRGLCRVNPPLPLRTGDGGHVDWLFPRTRGSLDWCGLYEEAEE